MDFTPREVALYYEARVPGLKPQGQELRGACPIHHGKGLNFSVNPDTGLATCHSQCGKGWDILSLEQELYGSDFVRAKQGVFDLIGRQNSPTNGNQSRPPSTPNRQSKTADQVRAALLRDGWKLAAEGYFSESLRQARFEHATRIQVAKGRPEKSFVWEHRQGEVWFSGAGGRSIPLYLNAVTRGRDQVEEIVLAEGWAIADALGRLEIAAGSLKEVNASNTHQFAGFKRIVIWPDRDGAGTKMAARVAELLRKHKLNVHIVAPPVELPDGGDVIDAIALGWSSDRIRALIASAQGPEDRSPHVFSVADILAADIPEASMLIEGVLPSAGASLIVGAAKSGKTLNAVQMAICIASGEALYQIYRVLNPGPVLVVEQDDPAGLGSVKTILQRSRVPVAGIPFHLVAGTTYQFGPEFLEWLENQILTLKIRFTVLDSYTALRGSRSKGVDIVKAEQADLSQLDALGKRTNSALLIIHHSSKGSAGLDWSEKAAGTFAMSAATESQIFISRFPDLDAAAPERLIRIRGRHSEDLEMVLRFRKESLDFDQVMEGGAATLYPMVQQLRTAFGTQPFTPKNVMHTTGLSHATAHRQINRLCYGKFPVTTMELENAIVKHGYGEYVLVGV